MNSDMRNLNELKNRCYFIPQLMRFNNFTDVRNELNILKGKFDDATTYSSDEKLVGTWINDEPIYRKVIRKMFKNLQTFSANTEYHIDIIDNLPSIHEMVDFKILWNTSYDRMYMSAKHQMPIHAWFAVGINGLGVISPYKIEHYGVTIIIDYTKNEET